MNEDDVQPELVDGPPAGALSPSPGIQPADAAGEMPELPAWRIAAAQALATMGVLPLGMLETSAHPAPALLGAIGGAAFGGGVIGFVTARDGRGALTGALLTGGLAGLLDASLLLRRSDQKTLGGLVGALSLASLVGAFWLSQTRPFAKAHEP